jgi:hypothetical protein
MLGGPHLKGKNLDMMVHTSHTKDVEPEQNSRPYLHNNQRFKRLDVWLKQ